MAQLIIFVGVVLCLFLAGNILAWLCMRGGVAQTELSAPKLFEKRKMDLKRIRAYVDQFSLIGVEGPWGDGKSFLWEWMRKDLSKSYEVVEISVLACNIDQLLPILVRDLTDILQKNSVFSCYSSRVEKLVAQSPKAEWFFRLMFPEPAGRSMILEGFQKDLAKVKRPIIVMYEDLDRVEDARLISQIFAIAEKLQGPRLKVLYQYDMERLSKLNFTRAYLEKYIPYTVRLSPLSMFEIVQMLLVENPRMFKALDMEDFTIFKKYGNGNLKDDMYVAFQLPILRLCVEEFALSVRGVKQYITEAAILLREREEYSKNKELVLRVLFVKHFLPDFFDRIQGYKELMEQFFYSYEGHEYTFQDIVEGYERYKTAEHGDIDFSTERIKAAFAEKDNRKIYCVLNFLGYAQMQVPNSAVNRVNEESNAKIDRLIASLICSGQKEYTDREFVLREIEKEIFVSDGDASRKSEAAQWRGLESIFKKCYGLQKEIDGYSTINKMGNSWFEDLFAAMRVISVPAKMALGLFRLFMYQRCKADNKALDMTFLRVCRYCKWDEEKMLFALLQAVVSLNIQGNFNTEDYFADFMREMLQALVRRGYLEDGVYREFLMSRSAEDTLLIVSEMQQGNICVDKELEKIFSQYKNIFPAGEKNLSLVKAAMEKLRDLVNAPASSAWALERVHVNVQCSSTGEDEEKRLVTVYEQAGQEAFFAAIKESQASGGIGLQEIKRLLKMLEEEKPSSSLEAENVGRTGENNESS